MPGKTKPDPYEKRIAVIDRFWEMYNQHPWPKRIDPQAQQMWDEAWIESVSQHYGVEYNGSIIDLDILIRREFKRLRRRTDEILKDLKRMDERDRKRAYRARKKAQQAGKKLVM